MKLIIENNKMYLEENNVREQATAISIFPTKKVEHVKGSSFKQYKGFNVQYTLSNGIIQKSIFKLEDVNTSILGEGFTEEEWNLLDKYFNYNEGANVTGQLVNNQLIVKASSTWQNKTKAFTNFADALKYIATLQQKQDEKNKKQIAALHKK